MTYLNIQMRQQSLSLIVLVRKAIIMIKPYHEIVTILSEKDSVLKNAIASVNTEIKPTPSIDVYLELLNSIVSQQLSVKVARIIWTRFTDLFSDSYPHSDQVLNMEHALLRGVGLSNSKANYIKNVAQFSVDANISFEYLNKMSDDEIIAYLTQIKGVGTWTVQMILMFPMDRPDVFPIDDLGIQNQMKAWYGIELEKKELKNKLVEIAEIWKPYRTLASKYIWQSNCK